ncbi:Os08g0255260 [Oryza sativa Japonica Group]|uniref:Os08g0255260 protein n=1 Tax=Oryza sativa subsp. japonica TaxID=39947 RepID=A0A0P0XDK1_ORYSJ|nr:Os08g0255260 [Oryza sativa Japonica Group]
MTLLPVKQPINHSSPSPAEHPLSGPHVLSGPERQRPLPPPQATTVAVAVVTSTSSVSELASPHLSSIRHRHNVLITSTPKHRQACLSALSFGWYCRHLLISSIPKLRLLPPLPFALRLSAAASPLPTNNGTPDLVSNKLETTGSKFPRASAATSSTLSCMVAIVCLFTASELRDTRFGLQEVGDHWI